MEITVLVAVWHVMKKGPQGYSWGGDTFNPLFLLEAVPMSYGVFAALSCSFDEVLPFVIQMSRAEWYCSSNTGNHCASFWGTGMSHDGEISGQPCAFLEFQPGGFHPFKHVRFTA